MRYLLLLLLVLSLYGDDNNTKEFKNNFKIIPLVSSNPTAGTGAGVGATYLYKLDNSSPSQAVLMTNYTDTKSWSILGMNKIFAKDNKIQSTTLLGYIYNNSILDLGDFGDLGSNSSGRFSPFPDSRNAKFDIKIISFAQQLLYKVHPSFYLGGQVYYVDQTYNSQNDAGKIFLNINGIEDSSRVAIGATVSYDTRPKSEKAYPRDATLINFVVNGFPSSLGDGESYYNAFINIRKYIHGFKDDDVFAMQLYAKVCSEDTPDAALAALGSRSILRGFAMGQFKARNLASAQAEYRYTFTGTRFRVTAFAGYANLGGGSKGTAITLPDGTKHVGNRDADNGGYGSGGLGVHYILQPQAGIDYRINVAYSSKNEASIYGSLNQAF